MTPSGRTYRSLKARWEALRERGEWRLSDLPAATAHALFCADAGDPARPCIAIAAGLHGDEPAGPWALLELAEQRALDPAFRYRVWPCINPSGFAARTRENGDGIDVNRTFSGEGSSPEARAVLAANAGRTFALSLDLHEDCDAAGFYCYEYGGGDIGRRAIGALDAAGFPIEPLDGTLVLAGPAYDEHYIRERGRVVADAIAEDAAIAGTSYSMRVARDSARHALTFETPSVHGLDERIAMHRTAVLAAIAALA